MADVKCKIVEICIYYRDNNIPRYLLLKRSQSEDIYPGIWQFVTGGIHEDEKAYIAAYREMREETKLSVERFFTVPYVSVFYDLGYDTVNLSPIFAAEVETSLVPQLSDEHAEYRWCSFDEAYALLVWPGQREGLEIVHRYIAGGEEEAGRLVEISKELLVMNKSGNDT